MRATVAFPAVLPSSAPVSRRSSQLTAHAVSQPILCFVTYFGPVPPYPSRFQGHSDLSLCLDVLTLGLRGHYFSASVLETLLSPLPSFRAHALLACLTLLVTLLILDHDCIYI